MVEHNYNRRYKCDCQFFNSEKTTYWNSLSTNQVTKKSWGTVLMFVLTSWPGEVEQSIMWVANAMKVQETH